MALHSRLGSIAGTYVIYLYKLNVLLRDIQGECTN